MLPVADAYRLWAPRYDAENAVTALERRLVDAASPAPAGRALLDAGCGTGRRLPAGAGAPRLAVGIDLVPEMLRAGVAARGGSPGSVPDAGTGGPVPLLAAADVRGLPFHPDLFDLLWLRLVAGHLPRLEPAYAELGRVAGEGARLVVSDFHPAAIAAGHARTFRGPDGRTRAVEHHVHSVASHEAAAGAAGWLLDDAVEAAAGEPERRYYERAGRAAQLERERDLPLVLVLCFRR